MLVEDDIENFLNYLEHVRAYSPRTLAAYRRDLKDWQSYLEKQGADEVSLPLARSYVAHLRSKTALSNRSINRRISALKSFYKYLQKRQRAEAESADSADSASAPPA
ncbi:MAG: site-specific integrase, partial [Spirochaetota bacterium]